ncbi:MAG: B12-binding domain-containing radical SAM protein [Anaerolineales bacterium]|nr:B12-binding domain-containing radical SAM protein [Anaerolineales bacterium]MCB9128568.1 B12-binding domain-containing radical SAM protein [Ardenticatenales bacterium]MCB9172946.1 B12-binding domain-containing radical SAM protein [Ardenticatenales bacterium]
MTDFLFGQSYYLHFDPKLLEAMQPYPPLGTMYAASTLREEGYEVALFDAMLAESEAEWAAQLASHRPRFAVIYEDNFNYLSKMCLLRMREAAFTMIESAQAEGCTVIVCGSDATDHAEGYLEAGADFVLLGEGEATLVELAARLTAQSTTPFDEIQGLAWQSDDGPRRNPRRGDIKDVDALPFPAWDLIDVERYRRIWLDHHGYFSMNMVTTRGCPYHCNWCAKPIWGQRYNSRSPENVVAELKWLKATYHPDHIWFADDIVGLKPRWWSRFADLVEAEGVRTPFKCLSRADLLLRDGDIPALARAGCDIVWIGAESGAQHVLDRMEKGTKVEQIYEAAARLHDAGVRVGFFLQFGYPGETRADIEKTIQMVRDCEPDDIGMSVSYPLPGTKFYERVKSELGTKQNWQDSSDLAMLYEGPFSTDFYRQLHTVLHKEYRSRKRWQALANAVQRPATLRPTHLLGAGKAGYHWLTLPWARRKLDALAHASGDGLTALAPALSHEESATPTPQER